MQAARTADQYLENAPPEGAIAGAAGGITIGIFVLLYGFMNFLVFYVVGESLHLSLAMEENTRLTAALLLRMHQESQPEEPPAYGPSGSGFVNEPFE